MKIRNQILIIVTLVFITKITYSQTTTGNNVRPATAAFNGWDGTGTNPGTLEIRNNFTNHINIFTNGTQKMTILGTSGSDDGYVGIGTTTPGQKLTVTGGNINVGSSTKSYMISGSKVLWHNGDPSSIYAGVGAGAATTASSTLYNTFVGNDAGKVTTSAEGNTAIGYEALFTATAYGWNTAVGYKALWSLSSSCNSCSSGNNLNVAVGYEALKVTQAYGGSVLGFRAGYFNTLGCSLVAIGEQAAYNNTDGNDNVVVGHDALGANTKLSNNVAVGTDALRWQDYASTTTCPVVGGYQTYGCVSSNNVAVGNASLYSNKPTTDNNGVNNTALGNSSLYSNTTGYANLGCGYQAGGLNQTGYGNVNLGYYAGYSNTTNYNSFIGFLAGEYTTTGDGNCFTGYQAGQANTTGGSNTFVGLDAGYNNTTANNNSALGIQALGLTTTGGSNVSLGYQAGYVNTTGSQNTFVGYSANPSGTGSGAFTNCAAFGYNATTNASNKYVVGNTAVTIIGGYANWSNLSDGRYKINVQENVKGLDFIRRLRPVTYNMDAQALDAHINQNRPQITDSSGNIINTPPLDCTPSANIVHSGFIAQEVEQASLTSGFISSIVNAPANPDDLYSLSYSEFVVPLVKAFQELDSIVKAQGDIIQSLQNGNRAAPGNNDPENLGQHEKQPSAIDVTLSSKTIVLNQNSPNPFKEQTLITYTIPENAKNVKIIFTDSRSNVLKEVEITQTGNGQLNVYAQDLSSGIYTYSLVIDGQTIDTKKMICNK